MPIPENETETEILARRQVEALERIANMLEVVGSAVMDALVRLEDGAK